MSPSRLLAGTAASSVLWLTIPNLLDGQDLPVKVSAQNMVRNGGFEQGLTDWSAGSYHADPSQDDGTEEIVTEGCLNGSCLKMSHGNSTWQGASQRVGKLVPGATYLLRAHFRTTGTHYGHTNVRDGSWRDGSCNIVGRSTTLSKPGSDGWDEITQIIRVPEEDQCGPLGDHEWSVYLYSYSPLADSSPVYYDDVSFESIDGYNTYDLEEDKQLAVVTCQRYTDSYPLTPCPDDVLQRVSEPGAGGSHIVISGARDRQEWLTFDVPVRPRRLYQIEVSLAVEDRVVFSYLDLDYPSSLTRQQAGIRDTVDLTKGIWSGTYDVTVDAASILPPIIKDAEYRSPSHLDWYTESSTFETEPGQFVARLAVRMSGFEGRLLVDGLTVREAASFIDDEILDMRVPEGYAGMRIVKVDNSPPVVETNAAVYAFSGDEIVCSRQGAQLASIRFSGVSLDAVDVRRVPGNVILDNGQLHASIGADSVVVVKLKAPATVVVSGSRRDYQLLEAGVLFAADGSQGVIFAPIHPPASVREMPYAFDAVKRVYDYSDAAFASLGRKTWTTIDGFDQARWSVQYDFGAGSGFVAQVFPPKEFDEDAYCAQRMHTMGTNTVQAPDADFAYELQRVGAQIETGLVWMSSYAASDNELAPPEEYCRNSDREPVSCDSEEAASSQPVGIRFDVTGPYAVAEPEAFARLVDAAHERGLRLIVYMSPQFYYTTDVDTFLADLAMLIDDFGVDGVYYDGLYSGRPLESLELVRKTRSLLGSGFYAQHASWVNTLVRRTHRYRAPFLDAQADVLWLGEGVKDVADEVWQYNFCGRGLSNTASMLLGELRPVDWTADRDTSVSLTLSPEEQVARTLACGGLFRTTPYGEASTIHDTHFQYSVPFKSSIFLQPYNDYCLEHTCGNGRCDVGESIFDCPGDCAPVSDVILQTDRGNEHLCPSDQGVAQWLVDGDPLYGLHYSFDQPVAGDVSGFEHHPHQSFGVTRTPSALKTVDGRLAHEFDSAAFLSGETTDSLRPTDGRFSMLATFLADEGASAGRQTILTFGPNRNLTLLLQDGRFVVEVLDGDKQYGTEEIADDDCLSGRCVVARHNDATWQGISQTVGPLKPGATYELGAMFHTSDGHEGYINLYDRDWRDSACMRAGRSYTAHVRGNGDWQSISVEVAVPATDDCGLPTSEHSWSALLYAHAPLADNSQVRYDSVWLTASDDPRGNLLANPGFEDGFDGWTHSSYIARDAFASGAQLADGGWHTVGVTYRQPSWSLYVDGSPAVTGTVRIAAFDSPGTWSIGSSAATGASESFVGYLDDLVVADRALSDAQVRQYAADQLRTLEHDGGASCLFVQERQTYTAARRSTAYVPVLLRKTSGR